MSANPISQYPSSSLFHSNAVDDTTTRGHIGKWQRVVNVGASSDTTFTGSNHGAGAVLITGADSTIYFSDGGSISGSALNTKELYEFGVSRVTTNATGDVYVFIRNMKII